MAPFKWDCDTDTTEAHPMTSTVRGPSAASASKFKYLQAWRNVVESCCRVCRYVVWKPCFTVDVVQHHDIWTWFCTFSHQTFCATKMLGPGGSAHLASGRYWHVVSPGTTIGDAFFTLSIPTSEISLAPSAKMWQQLLLASQAERNDLGRPSRLKIGHTRAYRNVIRG